MLPTLMDAAAGGRTGHDGQEFSAGLRGERDRAARFVTQAHNGIKAIFQRAMEIAASRADGSKSLYDIDDETERSIWLKHSELDSALEKRQDLWQPANRCVDLTVPLWKVRWIRMNLAVSERIWPPIG